MAGIHTFRLGSFARLVSPHAVPCCIRLSIACL